MSSRKLKLATGAKARTPFAPIDDAVAAIRAGQMIIVVDDENRENEGDLTMAAVEGDARSGQLHGAPRPRARLSRDDAGTSRSPRDSPGGVRQLVAGRDGHVRVDRRQGRHDDGHFGDRPRAHDSRGHRSGDRAARSRAARARVSAARAPGRRDGAGGPYRSGRGSVAHRGPGGRRRDLRNHERGRLHGARAGADEVRAQARPAHDHDRRPDPVSDADRDAGAAGGHSRRCRRRRGCSTSSRTRA